MHSRFYTIMHCTTFGCSIPMWCHYVAVDSLVLSLHDTSVHSDVSAPCQSLSRDHPLQAFHHLPRIFHVSHQHRHLCTPLAREHTSALPHLGPGDGAPRAVKMYPAATVSADQMPAWQTTLQCSAQDWKRAWCCLRKKGTFVREITF